MFAGLLDDAAKTTFAELGAGKAYLALMIARATEACNFIINDNRTFKLKADRILRRFIRDNVKHTSFVRCQADLNSFVIDGALQELESIAQAGSVAVETPWRVVGVGKHLCGAATDFALRSLLSYSAEHSKPGVALPLFLSMSQKTTLVPAHISEAMQSQHGPLRVTFVSTTFHVFLSSYRLSMTFV